MLFRFPKNACIHSVYLLLSFFKWKLIFFISTNYAFSPFSPFRRRKKTLFLALLSFFTFSSFFVNFFSPFALSSIIEWTLSLCEPSVGAPSRLNNLQSDASQHSSISFKPRCGGGLVDEDVWLRGNFVKMGLLHFCLCVCVCECKCVCF